MTAEKITSYKPSLNLNNESGQSLIEALAALTVAVIVIVVLIGLGIASMRSANLAKNNATAAKIANRDMEIAIAIADSNWDDLPDNDGSTDYYISTGTLEILPVSGSPPVEDIFTRKLNIIDVTSDEKEFVITIAFTTSSGDHSTILRTYVTNWH